MEKAKTFTTIHNLTPKLPAKNEVRKSRTYAFVFDLYCIVLLTNFICFTWMSFVNGFITNMALTHRDVAKTLFSGSYNLSLAIVYTSYFFFSYYLNNGKTLGKMLFKLQVYGNGNRNGELSAKEAFTRSVGYLFCNLLSFIPFVTIYFRKDMKSIADYISKTHVLREDEAAILDSLEEKPMAQVELFPEDPVAHRLSKIA
ncbi:RDD family protein [Bacteriovorax sp. DB6_IX]|uniref:RDD family protein n=1 Tax=Bacteriovorax sp. DB6_IX TaxID=1353530 RepID=UPI00042061AE|nr:RDD family protein [Bacteriovorax sp. DB6_IX]